ncbi:hypothetical protein [Candidatus Azobacteroides pseudotrichonymphae]|nr:hypothetical protein [Candidatus Azobacteroides pseudotrichonymphae]
MYAIAKRASELTQNTPEAIENDRDAQFMSINNSKKPLRPEGTL